jgi:hypothetical protein
VQERGGWTTAKVLFDVYGHFLPEAHGYADRFTALDGAQTAPRRIRVSGPVAHAGSKGPSQKRNRGADGRIRTGDLLITNSTISPARSCATLRLPSLFPYVSTTYGIPCYA